ncbi:Putative esterase, FIGfam005057 [hydrothermal vent metagenome]|uniref:Putative esterase, FIGfam005057 n=1 Tax=hydrothermal vent metagenome TaxID=652676 RepID=A0A1W1EBA0_9ZZZZ
MIIYIHGFGSHGLGGKASAFRAYFEDKDEEFIAPSLSYVPELAIQTLEELIKVCNNVKLIGSSLGGYYALYLANKYNLKACLINPSIYPYKTLSKVEGKVLNYYDNSYFEWNISHLDMLKKYEIEVPDQSKVLLLLQKGDEVLDYTEAVKKLPDATMVVEEGGDHGFVQIERHFERVERFLNEPKA